MKYLFGLAAASLLAMIGGFVLTMDREMERVQAAEPHLPQALGDAHTEVQPVVLELFTSQSCSSCPPADALAEQLAQRDDVIVISRPVTYWNRIGWEDTLSDERNTDLQRAYASRGLSGRNGVYTPQIVVDGEAGVVGSGENRNRTVTYTNSWLSEQTLGTWNGGGARFRLPERLPAGDRHVLILRETGSNGAGAILAGRWI